MSSETNKAPDTTSALTKELQYQGPTITEATEALKALAKDNKVDSTVVANYVSIIKSRTKLSDRNGSGAPFFADLVIKAIHGKIDEAWLKDLHKAVRSHDIYMAKFWASPEGQARIQEFRNQEQQGGTQNPNTARTSGQLPF